MAVELRLVTEENPPFNMVDGTTDRITGMSTELIEKAMTSVGVSYRIEITSWKRAYNAALADRETCGFSTTFTKERKDLFVWIGPLYSNDWVLITREGRSAPSSLDEIKGQVIGTYNGNVIADYLIERGFKVDQSAPNDLLNFKKLLAGRFDYMVAGRARFRYLKKKHGIEGLIETIEINHPQFYLACNKSISPIVADRLNHAFDRMRHDGTAGAIQKKFE